jgi:cell division protein FtsB
MSRRDLCMDEVKVWVLVAIVTIMSAILGFIMKVVTNQVIKRLDDIVRELKQLTKVTTIQEEQIKRLQDQDTVVNHRLNDHSKRIRSIELVINHQPEES